MNPEKLLTTSSKIYSAAILAGLAMPFAFAPYSFSPVAFLSLGVLFIAWQHCTAKQAAIASFLFGFASFSTSGIWVITSFIVHAKISPILSIVIFVSFLSILAFHIAAIGWIQARYRHTNCFVHFCLLLPALWVLAEIVRSNFLTGFPFLLLGYSQLNTPLDNLAPYVGVYGMSFITAIIAGLIVLLITHPAKWRAVVPGIVGAYIFSIALGTTTWTQSSSEGINIAVLPGNRPAADRWHKKNRQPVLDHFWETSLRYPHVDAILWPETALPMPTDRIPKDYREKLLTFARQTNTDIIMGVAEGINQDGRISYYNGILNFSDFENIYRKRKLIPFLEFYPLNFARRFIKRFIDIPMSDYQFGGGQQSPLRVAGQLVAPTICYEDTFTHLASVKDPEISVMVNLSEDGWFANTTAIPQRVQISRMRAKEYERYFVRVSNNGTSAVINHKGQIDKSNIGQPRESFEATIQPRTGSTPYMIYGDRFILAVVALIFLGLYGPGAWLNIQEKFKKD